MDSTITKSYRKKFLTLSNSGQIVFLILFLKELEMVSHHFFAFVNSEIARMLIFILLLY